MSGFLHKLRGWCYPGLRGNAAGSFAISDRGKLRNTKAYWEHEASGCTFYALWRDALLRSYLTLHLLIYEPAGAIIAAPTTSSPEEIGGERNWDYRYAWLRDASLMLGSFSLMGHKDEAAGFMGWLAKVCSIRGPEGQTLYNIDFDTPARSKRSTICADTETRVRYVSATPLIINVNWMSSARCLKPLTTTLTSGDSSQKVCGV